MNPFPKEDDRLCVFAYAWIRTLLGTDPHLFGYAARANPFGFVPVSAPCKRWEQIQMDTVLKSLYYFCVFFT